jgi:hypothetical protein
LLSGNDIFRIRKVTALDLQHPCGRSLAAIASPKDVCITYSALPPSTGGATRMDDLVEYKKQSISNDSQPSTGKAHSSLIA